MYDAAAMAARLLSGGSGNAGLISALQVRLNHNNTAAEAEQFTNCRATAFYKNPLIPFKHVVPHVVCQEANPIWIFDLIPEAHSHVHHKNNSILFALGSGPPSGYDWQALQRVNLDTIICVMKQFQIRCKTTANLVFCFQGHLPSSSA